MAVTSAHICNLALGHLNQTDSLIANLDNDQGTTAAQCRLHYDVARRFVLAYHPWNFATRSMALVDIGNPVGNYGFRYDYPSDCLKIQAIQTGMRGCVPVRYMVEDDGTDGGLSILTDQERAVAVYTRDVTNPAVFSPGFVTALSWYLASELAPAITGDLDRQEAALMVYRNSMAAARASDSNESGFDPELDSPWERARQTGVY